MADNNCSIGRRSLLTAVAGGVASVTGCAELTGSRREGSAAGTEPTTRPSIPAHVTSESVTFYDDWGDGTYTTGPAWRKYRDQGDYTARVVERETPVGGNYVLKLRQASGGATAGTIGWEDGYRGWDGEWKFWGSFMPREFRIPVGNQANFLRLYSVGDDPVINVSLGMSTPQARRRPFRIGGDLIDEQVRIHHPGWEKGTWYYYEIAHDGAGRYTGRIWEEGDGGRPPEPDAVSLGDPPGTEPRIANIQTNGNDRAAIEVNHSFVAWNRE